jgi:acetyl-CoA carboxylase biotin carboxyl carrier protein
MSFDLPLSAEDVAEIVAILDKTPYDRLDIRTSRFSLRVLRSGDGFTQELSFSEDAAPAAAVAATEAAVVAEAEGIVAIRSPLPGTFYRAPQPGAPAFVNVGDRVEPDTVIAIVETMKLMTSVPAGCAGVIEEIVVENARLVEAEAVLMRVRAA